MLTYENLGLQFKNRWIFQNLSGQFTPGEMVGIMGPNGSGKSSFLKCIANLLPPSQGTVFWDGKPLSTYTPEELAHHRSYVRADLNCQWDLTVEDVLQLYGPVADSKILETLAFVKAERLYGKAFPHLSGGERSLVLLALSLIHNPSLILLDEITAMLDETYAQHTMQLLRDQTETGKSVTIILHDRALAEKYCHRIINFLMLPF